MRAVLDAGPLRTGDWLDLARGALDAWLHPAVPSRVPALASLVGGGLWTMVAAAVVFQPVPPDWPGYLAEILLPALLAAGFLLVATLGCVLRAGDGGGRTMAFAAGLCTIGYVTWMAALAATTAGLTDGPTLAAAQTFAMIGTTLIGAVLVQAGDETVGLLLVVGSVAMLIPWAPVWLAFGAAWTAVGIVLELERPSRLGARWRAS
ncbi:MAG: hypothetical protein A2Z32_06715 [Chloroflexi bacterium RBG_16_69_14]|nr:MAG: hypothetical protein A2Z32_06715 [Chloroflexi bacterium RBG_16_69_14]